MDSHRSDDKLFSFEAFCSTKLDVSVARLVTRNAAAAAALTDEAHASPIQTVSMETIFRSGANSETFGGEY